MYFANHASIDAFTADVDLYGAVFPVHVVEQGLDKNGESRTLQHSLDRHASVSEDADIVDQMLRPYDGDIQVGVSVMGPGGDAPVDWREMVRPRRRKLSL